MLALKKQAPLAPLSQVRTLTDDRWRTVLQIDELKAALRALIRVRKRSERIRIRALLERRLKEKMQRLHLLDHSLDLVDPVWG